MTPRLLIGPPESEADAAAWATPDELREAQAFASERRRREFLAWRAAVRRCLGCDVGIAYDQAGAPTLPGREEHLSVAHCEGCVAVCISPRRCAVDVEPERRDFGRAADRFMTPAERALSDDPLLPALVWCAKETLYKYAGVQGLDLLRDLSVERVDLAQGRITGRIRGGEPLELSVRRQDGFLVVYIL